MLVVTVEVWPGGYADHKREIAQMRIGNMSNLNDISDYIGAAHEYGNHNLNIPETSCRFEIKNYARKQSVWNLINLATAEIKLNSEKAA